MKAGIAVVCLGLVVAAAGPSPASITRSDFPSAAAVEQAVGQSQGWSRYLSKPNQGGVLGSRPRGCRSDLPFKQEREFRRATYWPNQPDAGATVAYTAGITVHRFSSARAAARAMKRAQTFVKRCPKSTEWVCTQCDGIYTTWQRLTRLRRVGDQSFAVVGRQMENFGSRFRSVVARDGRIVIRADVSTGSTDVDGPRFPTTRPTKAQVRAVALEALTSAS